MIGTTAQAGTLMVLINAIGGSNSVMADIAIGEDGSEVIIASNLWAWGPVTSYGTFTFQLPIKVPANTKVKAKIQAVQNGGPSYPRTAQIGCYVIPTIFKNLTPFSGMFTLGDDAANTTGTQIPTGTANAKGAFTAVGGATPKSEIGPHKYWGTHKWELGKNRKLRQIRYWCRPNSE